MKLPRPESGRPISKKRPGNIELVVAGQLEPTSRPVATVGSSASGISIATVLSLVAVAIAFVALLSEK